MILKSLSLSKIILIFKQDWDFLALPLKSYGCNGKNIYFSSNVFEIFGENQNEVSGLIEKSRLGYFELEYFKVLKLSLEPGLGQGLWSGFWNS